MLDGEHDVGWRAIDVEDEMETKNNSDVDAFGSGLAIEDMLKG